MDWGNSFWLPLLSSIFAPICLFLLAYFGVHVGLLQRMISHVYTTVTDRLSVKDTADDRAAPGHSENDGILVKIKCYLNKILNKIFRTSGNKSTKDSKVLHKRSKNYGYYNGWDLTTFYMVTKNQLKDNDKIEFFIKGTKHIIVLSTKSLLENFDLKEISDGKDRIRIYIYRDKSNQKFYLVRFGKKIFRKPYELKKLSENSNNYKIIIDNKKSKTQL